VIIISINVWDAGAAGLTRYDRVSGGDYLCSQAIIRAARRRTAALNRKK
jgi:hypothetical protein